MNTVHNHFIGWMSLCHLEKPVPDEILEVITSPVVALRLLHACNICEAVSYCPTYRTCKMAISGQIEQGDAELQDLEPLVGFKAYQIITE